MLGPSVFTLGLLLRVAHYYILLCKGKRKHTVFHNSQNDCATMEHLAMIHLANIHPGDVIQDFRNVRTFHFSTFKHLAPLLKRKSLDGMPASGAARIFAQYLLAKSIFWEKFYGSFEKFTAIF